MTVRCGINGKHVKAAWVPGVSGLQCHAQAGGHDADLMQISRGTLQVQFLIACPLLTGYYACDISAWYIPAAAGCQQAPQ